MKSSKFLLSIIALISLALSFNVSSISITSFSKLVALNAELANSKPVTAVPIIGIDLTNPFPTLEKIDSLSFSAPLDDSASIFYLAVSFAFSSSGSLESSESSPLNNPKPKLTALPIREFLAALTAISFALSRNEVSFLGFVILSW